MFEGNQLLDASTLAFCGKLAVLLSAGVTKMPQILGPEVRVMVIKAMAIKGIVLAMVKAMVRAMVRPMVGPIPWMPMNSRGIQCISFKGINYGHLIIISIGLMRLS